jgi:hypothetical protein
MDTTACCSSPAAVAAGATLAGEADVVGLAVVLDDVSVTLVDVSVSVPLVRVDELLSVPLVSVIVVAVTDVIELVPVL